MSLISHEISRADNAGEISQFRSTLPIMQKQYQGKNEVVHECHKRRPSCRKSTRRGRKRGRKCRKSQNQCHKRIR